MTKKSNNTDEMTFWEHLEDLRWVFIRSLIAIIVISIIAFLNKTFVFEHILLAPKEPWFITNKLLCHLSEKLGTEALCINNTALKLINIKLAGQFTTHLFTSFALGIFIASPYIFFEFWNFAKPALSKNELNNSRGAVLVCSVLFTLGVLFAYFVILPITINFLGTYMVSEQVENTITLKSYITNMVSITLSIGFIFEIPVLILFLTKVGIITPQILKQRRKIVFVILLCVSAIITPPDIFSMILVAIPMVILYEISIGVSQRVYSK